MEIEKIEKFQCLNLNGTNINLYGGVKCPVFKATEIMIDLLEYKKVKAQRWYLNEI